MNIKKKGLTVFLALIPALIFLLLAQTGLAKNTFYTTQPANATMEVNGYSQANDTGLASYWKCDNNFNDSSGMKQERCG